jgi:hypothetical protein
MKTLFLTFLVIIFNIHFVLASTSIVFQTDKTEYNIDETIQLKIQVITDTPGKMSIGIE